MLMNFNYILFISLYGHYYYYCTASCSLIHCGRTVAIKHARRYNDFDSMLDSDLVKVDRKVFLLLNINYCCVFLLVFDLRCYYIVENIAHRIKPLLQLYLTYTALSLGLIAHRTGTKSPTGHPRKT